MISEGVHYGPGICNREVATTKIEPGEKKVRLYRRTARAVVRVDGMWQGILFRTFTLHCGKNARVLQAE